MQHFCGFPVALVLADDRGEYEVRNAFKMEEHPGLGAVAVNIDRVFDAINAREQERPPRQTRPVY